MASESKAPAELSAIPNSVSGDGTTFVRGLKRFLRAYSRNIEQIALGGERNVTQVADVVVIEQHIGGNNNVFVKFNKDIIADYSYSEIWLSSSSSNTWRYNGSTDGDSYIVSNVVAGETYYIKVVACNKDGNASSFSDAPTGEIFIKGDSLICNTPEQFYWDNAEHKWIWTGYVDNNYTNFFEIRLDTNVGALENKIGTVGINDGVNYLAVEPPVRMGTAYLYVCNIFGQYNTPYAHIFNLSPLPKPEAPRLTKGNEGLIVELDALPSEAISYVVEVNGEEFETNKQVWTYYDYSGELTVRYCFTDSTGKGVWSEPSTIIVGAYIQPSNIARNSITADKIASYAITAEKISSGAITTDKLGAKAITSEKIDAGAVRAENLSANSVHASHLYGENIDLTGQLAITGGAVLLNKDGLRLSRNDGKYTLFDTRGITMYTADGIAYSALHRICIGVATHGDKVRFSPEWDTIPRVITVPISIQINEAEYAQSNVWLDCRATNVQNTGFDVVCQTILKSGSKGGFPINTYIEVQDEYYPVVSANLPAIPEDVEVISITATAVTWEFLALTPNPQLTTVIYANGKEVARSVNTFSVPYVAPPDNVGGDVRPRSDSAPQTIRFDNVAIPRGAALSATVWLNPAYVSGHNVLGSVRFTNLEYESAYDRQLQVGSVYFIAVEDVETGYTIENEVEA